MESLSPPKTIKVYQLLRLTTKSGMIISACGTTPGNPSMYIGNGMYLSQSEAEQNRTLETLKDLDGSKFFVFELEFPNPAYRE